MDPVWRSIGRGRRRIGSVVGGIPLAATSQFNRETAVVRNEYEMDQHRNRSLRPPNDGEGLSIQSDICGVNMYYGATLLSFLHITIGVILFTKHSREILNGDGLNSTDEASNVTYGTVTEKIGSTSLNLAMNIDSVLLGVFLFVGAVKSSAELLRFWLIWRATVQIFSLIYRIDFAAPEKYTQADAIYEIIACCCEISFIWIAKCRMEKMTGERRLGSTSRTRELPLERIGEGQVDPPQ